MNLEPKQVEQAAELLDEGNTIPFVARYRKEATGSLDEETLRGIDEELNYLRNLNQRKAEVQRLIQEQGEMTESLREQIVQAETLGEVNDIYRPYRPKRRTRAEKAREKGLEPLAAALWDAACGKQPAEHTNDDISPETVASEFAADSEVEVDSAEEALSGARDIISEWVADDLQHREFVRSWMFDKGQINTSVRDDEVKERTPYEDYYDYSEPAASIKPHRILAINRAENEGIIRVKVQVDDEQIISHLRGRVITRSETAAADQVAQAVQEAFKRLMGPSIERELRSKLTDDAEEHAIDIFTDNLEQLLLQSPVKNRTVMGIDPAYRTGCKIAVVDESGNLLAVDVIYPTPPRSEVQRAKEKLVALINEHRVELIAIGNGTASRETEIFVTDMLGEEDFAAGEKPLKYTIVNEAGASVYSASALAGQEFPDLDVSERSAVSIARRLQDPLAELVKIDPKSIGVGQYQHDVNQNRLADALEFVVEKCVNRVGVDLESASTPLLERVSGIGPFTAENIVDYCKENGFEARSDLLDVSGIGPKTFEQCAGFLRLSNSEEPLDATAIHPESYDSAYRLLKRLDAEPEDIARGGLSDIDQRITDVSVEDLSEELEVGLFTLRDIISAFKRPGRDPREDMPGPIFRSDVLSLKDLQLGMNLRGTVRNVVDFGAFVDVGVKCDGLVHISELSTSYVSHPSDVVSVGDVVQVMVLDVDRQRERISLTMQGIDQPQI